MEDQKELYRAEIEHEEGATFINIVPYKVVAKTKHSFIIELWQGKARRVYPNSGRQPFAYITKEAAVKAAIHRKTKHISILKWQLKVALAIKDNLKIMAGIGNYPKRTVLDHYELSQQYDLKKGV